MTFPPRKEIQNIFCRYKYVSELVNVAIKLSNFKKAVYMITIEETSFTYGTVHPSGYLRYKVTSETFSINYLSYLLTPVTENVPYGYRPIYM